MPKKKQADTDTFEQKLWKSADKLRKNIDYVGIPDEEDDGIPFEEKMEVLTQELAEQMCEGLALDKEIKIQLGKVGFSLEVE